jgi:hypothetical protein
VELAAGTIFAGDYRVVRPLSAGGMGALFVVLQLPTGKQRALKLMHRELVYDPASRQRFEHALVSVKVGGKWFAVHEKIRAPLERVAARIDEAMKRDPSLAKFFESPGGTFNWRKIAGSDELSMHAWAIAIDLDTKRASYWRNAPQNPLVWKNAYPQAIVDAFESEGFIWGGRWYHFDTMHFEYRPELLDAS